MTEMSVASPTEHFVALHAVAAIAFFENIFFIYRSPETWPARPRIKLSVGFEQVVIATDATVDSFVVSVPVLAGERPFGSFSAGDFVLLSGELLFPFGIRLDDLFAHKESFLCNRVELYFFRARLIFRL